MSARSISLSLALVLGLVLLAPGNARVDDGIRVHAAGRGAPWINLGDGLALHAYHLGAGAAQAPEAGLGQPLALAAGDVDGDGVDDVIVGYGAGGSGALAIWRGNVDAIYPHSPEARARKATRTFTAAPFHLPARVVALPATPDFVGVGDFDADGHLDVVVAARGARALHWLRGDGRGRFDAPQGVSLPGAVTALAIGEVNRADGLPDVVVGVAGRRGGQVLVFESPHGALHGVPEAFAVPAAPTALAAGRLDGDSSGDVAVGAGRTLVLIHGRDRRLSLDAERQARVPAAQVTRRVFGATIGGLALGDFAGDQRTGLAVLTADSTVHVLARPHGGAGEPIAGWMATARPSGASAGARLVAAKVSSLPGTDLVVADGGNRRLAIHTAEATTAPVALATVGEPLAVLPMRLNSSALSDLVVLARGETAPSVLLSAPARVFLVTSTADSGAGSLRQAILDANASPGADAIYFENVSVLIPLSPLPKITQAVTIDGTTSPSPRLDLRGTSAGSGADGLAIDGGPSVVRGLVIEGFLDDGIQITSAGNIIEGNWIGLTAIGGDGGNGNHGIVVIGVADNRIGGTTAAARNIISGNDDAGVYITGSLASGNVVRGNRIGTRQTGATAAIANGSGVVLKGAPDNTVGGTTAGARNLISGNGQGVRLLDAGTTGNLVQGNFIGTNLAGNGALGNTGNGVQVGNAPGNTIGGTAVGARNVISGNNRGVNISGSEGEDLSETLVQGNFIGTNAVGTAAIGNTVGVDIDGASDNVVGGSVAGAGNVISGNVGNGVGIVNVSSALATGNVVAGNIIGADVTGTVALGNGSTGVSVGSQGNTIGGTTPGARNVISGNSPSGVFLNASASGNVVTGNFIGTDITGTADLGNSAAGVRLEGANGNTIGGTTAGAGNVISGNGTNGVELVSGATGNTVARNLIGTDATGAVILKNNQSGVRVSASPGNTIGGTSAAARNVISGNGTSGVLIIGGAASGNTVIGNLIGTDVTGTAALGNTQNGVVVNGAPGNTIGGTSAGARNVISGNAGYGVVLTGSTAAGNTVAGNFIGTDLTGTIVLGNTVNGVIVVAAPGNTIGGTSAGARNVISGNGGAGVLLSGSTATGNTVAGNFIGPDATGAVGLGNSGHGIVVTLASNNTIGGTTSGAPNTIAFNGNRGVVIFSGTGNAIRRNSIFSNGSLGIDLGNNGLTPNDAGDVDGGANNLQNFPVVTSAVSGASSTIIAGTLGSTASASFTVELFSSPTCDASGNGEGQTFRTSIGVATDGSGAAGFTVIVSPALTVGHVVTATATSAGGDTSEFSACRTVTSPPAAVKVLAPNAGAAWKIGQSQNIRWSATGIAGNVTVQLSRDGGRSWTTLGSHPAGAGVHTWRVSGPVTEHARVRVRGAGDTSATGDFAIRQ